MQNLLPPPVLKLGLAPHAKRSFNCPNLPASFFRFTRDSRDATRRDDDRGDRDTGSQPAPRDEVLPFKQLRQPPAKDSSPYLEWLTSSSFERERFSLLSTTPFRRLRDPFRAVTEQRHRKPLAGTILRGSGRDWPARSPLAAGTRRRGITT